MGLNRASADEGGWRPRLLGPWPPGGTSLPREEAARVNPTLPHDRGDLGVQEYSRPWRPSRSPRSLLPLGDDPAPARSGCGTAVRRRRSA